MNVASTDIGTNTVLLLIAEIDPKRLTIRPLINEYRTPRIGQGTKKSGLITDEKLKLLIEVLGEFDKIIKSYKCDHVILTGTNAFRMASNTPFIINEIKKLFQYDLNVISGDVEAEYAYLGAISDLNNHKNTMVIDIGGSSTEIIVGMENEIISKRSLQLGSVSANEQFLLHNPPHESEIQKLISEIKIKLIDIQLKNIPNQVIAVAGTATTLSCMLLGLNKFDEDAVANSKINYRDLKNLIENLKQLSVQEVLEKYNSVITGREDIIFTGACILLQIMETLRIENVLVSTRGIRYGAIVNYMMIK